MRHQKKDAMHGNLLWHPAFFQAMQLELVDYRDLLEFNHEYELVSGPLRIDLLIIKKPKEVVIDKNIARIFRAINIVEYKSPEDYLSVKDFFKVCGYANLYAAKTAEVDLSDITLTFIGSRYPRTLLHYLIGTLGYTVTKTSPGVYQVHGDHMPIQIIESKKLSESENLWLKSLTNDLEIRGMGAILDARRKWKGRGGTDAYMDIILRANAEAYLEVNKMGKKTGKMTLEEVFVEIIRREPERYEDILTRAGLIPEWIEQGVKRGIEQGLAESIEQSREQGREQGIEQGKEQGLAEGQTNEKLEIARKMKEAGISEEQIQTITGLSSEAIEQL